NTLSIVTANKATKTATKTAKPTKTATKTAKTATKTAKTAKPAKEWDNAIITRIASGVIAVAKAEELREKLAADIKEFRSYGVKLGASRRTCAMSQEFYAAFLAQGVTEKTATNYLSCLRESINNGR